MDDKKEKDDKDSTTTATPSVYKYPGDGSLLMPEIPDEDEKVTQDNTKKRSASSSIDQEQESTSVENKRIKK